MITSFRSKTPFFLSKVKVKNTLFLISRDKIENDVDGGQFVSLYFQIEDLNAVRLRLTLYLKK